MEILLINTMHAQLQIPAFYTIIPGAHFRERSLGTSVGMFSAKHIYENNPAPLAIERTANTCAGPPDTPTVSSLNARIVPVA